MSPPTGDQLVAFAMTQRGRAKGYKRENVNAYTTWYYGDNTAASWCLIFVCYCLNHFGALGLLGGKIAYVPSLKGRVRRQVAHLQSADPQGRPGHVRLQPDRLARARRDLHQVARTRAKTRFQSIEGNTGDDLVATRTRYWSDVFGYVKPGLAVRRPGTYPGVIYRYAKGWPLQTGSHVTWIQQHLTAHGHATKVDGKYGPDTAAAVKDFQRQTGLAVDGEVGGKTWAALAK